MTSSRSARSKRSSIAKSSAHHSSQGSQGRQSATAIMHNTACARAPLIGRSHYWAARNPYIQCVTRNQLRTLFTAKNANKAMRVPTSVPDSDRASRDSYYEQRLSALGCGVFACAWPRNRTTVVKITNDQSDVASLIKANHAGVKGVPKLYKVWKLMSPRHNPRGVPNQSYGMIVERLYPHPAAKNIYCIRDSADAEEAKVNCCHPTDKDCLKLATQITTTGEELLDLGIRVRDLHEENIGVDRKGNWKILDMGLTTTPLTEKLPELRGPGHARRRRLRYKPLSYYMGR